MEFIIQLGDVNIIVEILRTLFICITTFIIALKISNKYSKVNFKLIILLILLVILAITYIEIERRIGVFYAVIFIISFLGIIFAKYTICNIEYAISIITISLSINYIMYYISLVLSFCPIVLFNIKSDYISFIIILLLNCINILLFLNNRRIKKGIIFLKEKMKDEYFNSIVLNISIIILFLIIIILSYDGIVIDKIFGGLVVFSILLFITIKKSLQLYYKQKLLIKDLEETRIELSLRKEDIKELEKEILNYNKITHSVSHKQKALEYKISELKQSAEISNEINIEGEIKKIRKEILGNKMQIELQKTGVEEVDNMLKYMQSECLKNKIDFELQINGNIHQMVNNFISKEKLEILIADHIKNAIIAIQHSNNQYKNILVRIGKIDEEFSLYIYDTGIEFEKETLERLGREPTTTHKDENGSGMGFMNTFDTLAQYNASLIIKKIGKPSKDNFTKVLIIKFDNKNNFKVESYK